jgi:beta-lactamase regulating signal transducer with metallopeptidase domain/beta-lactamase class D
MPHNSIFTKIVSSDAIKNPYHQFLKNKNNENSSEVLVSINPEPRIDITYLYIIFSITFILGLVYHIYKTYKDIYKIKLLVDSAQHYKKYQKIVIKISDKCTIPFSVRLMRCAYIILPISILRSSINTRIAIAHEGQHHRQGDCLWAYLTEFTRIIFWFNPFINSWYRIFHELQELACDETLVSTNIVSAHDYGSCLFDVAKHASPYLNDHLACTAQMISSNENETTLITKRIGMLLKYDNNRVSKAMLGSIFAICAISIIVPLGTAYAAKELISIHTTSVSIDRSSINPKIQNIAANEISAAVNKTHAKSGAIVIADAHTGKIIAFAETRKSRENNSWDTRIFNPASTIKPFIAAAAIDSGVASASTTYDCPEAYQVDGKEFINSGSKVGTLSVTDAVASSVNTCMIKVAQATGAIKTRQILSRFGFDMITAWNDHKSDALNLANTAMGSSIPVTLGSLTKAFIILANKGHDVPANSRNAVSETTAKIVTGILEKVVTHGTGKRAAINNVLVAGKTGTLVNDAHTSSLALFAGYAPSNSPQYVSVVIIENAKLDGSLSNSNGGNVSAPVFHNTIKKILMQSK